MLTTTFSYRKTFIITFVLAVPVLFNNSSMAQGKVVGYYASWNSNLLPYSKIEYSNLTHIIVAFGTPNSDGSITYDGGIPFTHLVETAHSNGVKVLISIGRANSDSNFTAATLDLSLRAKMIFNIANFLQTNNYDGVDIDWETPTNTSKMMKLDSLVQEMRTYFNKIDSSWLITVAIPGGSYSGQYFDIRTLVNYVDWFNVMCYNYVGSWTTYTGFNAPLYIVSIDPNHAGSDSSSVEYWLSRGSRQITIPINKLVLGVPFYGNLFNANGLYKKLTNTIVSYPYYADAMSYINLGWTYHWYDAAKEPYLINQDTTKFITFEDTNSVKLKAEFAARKGLGGIMIWELSQGLYNDKQPLLETVANTLRTYTSIKENKKIVVNNYELYNNYPNPFNPSTIISFSIPKNEPVKLIVYNILGQEIKVLLDREINEGIHKVEFDASNLSSRIYLYTLITEDFISTKKMILIK